MAPISLEDAFNEEYSSDNKALYKANIKGRRNVDVATLSIIPPSSLDQSNTTNGPASIPTRNND